MKLITPFFLLAAVACAPLVVHAQNKSSSAKTGNVVNDAAMELFKANNNNKYESIRIPVVLAAKNNRLIAFAEGRKQDGDQGMNDIIYRISDNNGRSWSSIRVAVEMGKDTCNNPCPVYDEETGHISLVFQRFPAGVKERQNDLQPGLKAAPKVISNHLIVSKDNGQTWSKPVDITATTKGSDITLLAGGPNIGVQLTRGAHKGRLVIPFNQTVGFGNWFMNVIYSDDHGKNWKLGEKVPGKLGWVNETAVAETDDGGLYLNSRMWGNSGGYRKVSWSSDAGNNWTELVNDKALICTCTQGTVLRYSFSDDAKAGNKSRLLYAGPVKGRSHGTVLLSYDEGKTWKYKKLAVPGAYAYSSLVKLSDGRIGLAYEPGAGKEIRYTTFDLAWLTDGADTGK